MRDFCQKWRKSTIFANFHKFAVISNFFTKKFVAQSPQQSARGGPKMVIFDPQKEVIFDPPGDPPGTPPGPQKGLRGGSGFPRGHENGLRRARN